MNPMAMILGTDWLWPFVLVAMVLVALFTASLDHTIWFHRPIEADRWHVHDFTCHTFVGGRGLSLGNVFALDGTHVATVAQEVLLRDTRERD